MILGVMNITENYNFAGHTRGYERYARVDFVQPRSQDFFPKGKSPGNEVGFRGIT